MKIRLFAIFIFLGVGIAQAQIIPQGIPVYEPNQLQKDFSILRGALEDFHAGLYRYTPKNEMDSIFDSVYLSLNTKMDELSYFRKLASIISNIHCDHLWILPSDSTTKIIWQGTFLPLEVKMIEGRAYCFQNFSDDSLVLKPGYQILKINGITIDSLIEFSNSKLPGDGFIETEKIRELERHFLDVYAFHIGQPDRYRIEYLDEDKILCKTDIKALSYKDIKNKKKSYESITSKGNLRLKFLDSLTAILKVKGFGDWKLDKKKVKFEKELKKTFFKIDSSKITNLIIDVRDNDGGDDDLGLNLFSYFHDKPIVEFNRMEFRMKKSKYFRYSDMSGFKFWLLTSVLNKTKKINDSTFIVKSEKTLKPYGPSRPQFDGDIYILINGRSSSTTSDFVALMKSYDKAIFIGEETGGGYYGNTSAVEIEVTLPNTKIKVWTPTVCYTTNVKPIAEFGRGTIPDYEVQPSIQDEINDIDTELNFTLKIIKEKAYDKQ